MLAPEEALPYSMGSLPVLLLQGSTGERPIQQDMKRYAVHHPDFSVETNFASAPDTQPDFSVSGGLAFPGPLGTVLQVEACILL